MKFFIFLISIFSLSYSLPTTPNAVALTVETNPDRNASSDTLLYFYVWGLFPNPASIGSCKQLYQRKYGFAKRVVAGCIVSTKQVSIWQKHNQAVQAQLTEKWGANWEEKFKKEVADCKAVKLANRKKRGQ